MCLHDTENGWVNGEGRGGGKNRASLRGLSSCGLRLRWGRAPNGRRAPRQAYATLHVPRRRAAYGRRGILVNCAAAAP